MSDTATAPLLTSEGSGGKSHDDGVHGHHPSERKYVMVAIFLAVLTAIEVGLYYVELHQALTNAILLALAAFKFATVLLYFMHLRFDNPILRRLFVSGFVLAASIYLAVLAMQHALTGELVATSFAVMTGLSLAGFIAPKFARRS